MGTRCVLKPSGIRDYGRFGANDEIAGNGKYSISENPIKYNELTRPAYFGLGSTIHLESNKSPKEILLDISNSLFSNPQKLHTKCGCLNSNTDDYRATASKFD